MEGTEELLHTSIEIFSGHAVFDGHFPSNPVLPGVCTLHITGELLSKYLNRKYMLIKSENIKFISLVIPDQNKILHYAISFTVPDINLLSVKCTVTSNEVEVLKMKGNYICQ